MNEHRASSHTQGIGTKVVQRDTSNPMCEGVLHGIVFFTMDGAIPIPNPNPNPNP